MQREQSDIEAPAFRRKILYIAGYDFATSDAHFARFKRGLDVFSRTWNLDVTATRPLPRGAWTVNTAGHGWKVESEFELLEWDDLIEQDSRRTVFSRLVRGARAYANLVFTGTMFRYARASPRYTLFALYPVALLLLFSALARLVTAAVSSFLTMDLVLFGLVWAFGVLLLARWSGRRWRLNQALDDWIFSDEYIHGRRPDVESRVVEFAARVRAELEHTKSDELIIVGHSLGAMLAVDALSRSLEWRPQQGPYLGLLTVGSTIPKFTLHPAARRLREAAARVAGAPSVDWVEYQSRDDPISFYKIDPVRNRRIERDQMDRKPIIRRVQIHDMLQQPTFNRLRFRFLRLHYQCVMGNDRRSAYDYYMMACGPIPFGKWTRSARGFLDFSVDSPCVPAKGTSS